jgi:hypothetical protein
VAFRGYFALDDVELINSTRTLAHIGAVVPTTDVGILTDLTAGGPFFTEDPGGSGLYDTPPLTDPDSDHLYDPTVDMDGSGGLYSITPGPCSLTEFSAGLLDIPPSSSPMGNFYSPPNGSRRYGKGLIEVEPNCWEQVDGCGTCRQNVGYDDSWPGLQAYLDDAVYRPELAPWYSTRIPESAEFMGIWVLDVKGLGPTPIQRTVTELTGDGGAAGPHRDRPRTIQFEAVVMACTNAGLEYGKDWLGCLLRETKDRTDSVLRFFSAHPSRTAAAAADLLREARGVVYTKELSVSESHNPSNAPHAQATMEHITWEMVATSPYVYLPPVTIPVEWDTIVSEPIQWVHAPDCVEPESCDPMPVLFSETCVPETIEVANTPPPSCGGCMPVCALESYVFEVPTWSYATRCRETAVTLTIKNTGGGELTAQAYWRPCNSDIRCDIQKFPLQIAGLPAQSSLVLDGVASTYYALLDGIKRRPQYIVGTPNGAPWRPPIIDRENCWEFVIQAPPTAEFTVSMSLADREP